jgi:octaprenyl-diphosphate synthase
MPVIGAMYESITQDLTRICQIIDDELFSDLAVVNDLCEQAQGYRGKMLRPALLLLSGQACGSATDEHLTLGAVLEIVHMATLVHDDVLDEADLRRRRPTINRLQGNEAAVLFGDYLISHAFHLCSTIDTFACRQIGAATNTVCEGELQQVHHRGDFKLTSDQYVEIIGRKTATLTGVACLLGAKYAGASESVVSEFQQYGLEVGMAFQITDDVLDIVGSQDQMGKTLGRDLDERKLTLPIIHGLNHSSPVVQRHVRELLLCERPDRGRLAEVLTESGSVAFALASASDFINRAVSRLDVLAPSDARSALSRLANLILSREV